MKRETRIQYCEEAKLYIVTIYHIDGSVLLKTHGDTLIHAFAMGKEALELYEECEAEEHK